MSVIHTSRPTIGFRATSLSQNPLPVGVRGGVKIKALEFRSIRASESALATVSWSQWGLESALAASWSQ